MIVFILLCGIWLYAVETRDLLLSIPPVKPVEEDQYICHGFDLKNETLFITGFQPQANASHAHHMMIYSCVEPGSTDSTWNCREMVDGDSKNVCKSGSKIVYAWAMNAPGFILPPDVSIMVGKAAGSQFLVLQNHYKNIDYFKNPDSLPDQSGFFLTVQNKPTKKLAGIYLLVTDGSIPAHSTVFMEAACSYTGKVPLNPFAFRAHTHKLGKLVSGYIIHNQHWEEIGKKSPQIEQLFYPVNKALTIQPGDTLAARCIMENKGNELVKIGPTRNDEMCNFYIYYWVDRKDQAQLFDTDNEICFTNGWPKFKWKDIMGSMKIPDAPAQMPGENRILKEMIADIKENERKMDELFSNNLVDYFEPALKDDISNENMVNNYKFDNFPNEVELF